MNPTASINIDGILPISMMILRTYSGVGIRSLSSKQCNILSWKTLGFRGEYLIQSNKHLFNI